MSNVIMAITIDSKLKQVTNDRICLTACRRKEVFVTFLTFHPKHGESVPLI